MQLSPASTNPTSPTAVAAAGEGGLEKSLAAQTLEAGLRSMEQEAAETDVMQDTMVDISFSSPTHRGRGTVDLIRELSKMFPQLTPLAIVLKQFLKERNLHAAYTGGLSSYCLVLMITSFLHQQHQHLAERGGLKSIPLGRLLLDFLFFFGRIFDPRVSAVSLRARGDCPARDRIHGPIDPLYIEDPFLPDNNVGRNCFRVMQVQKAFADASVKLEAKVLGAAGTSGDAPTERLLTCILNSTAFS